jgi:hypothetical protein
LYYLQSRYYNPEWGRFINADVIIGTTGELLGHNMFAYCFNNPINAQDKSGYRAVDLKAEGGIYVYVSLASLATIAAQTVSRVKQDPPERKYKVYALVNEKREAMYVGRTGQGLDDRFNQHLREDPIKKELFDQGNLRIVTLFEGCTKAESRGLEQIAYDFYRVTGNELLNKINPIFILNPYRGYYLNKGARFIMRWGGEDELLKYVKR